ncbi:MAG: hypothetical protein WEG56_01030 [Chloroflexota bacterium]
MAIEDPGEQFATLVVMYVGGMALGAFVLSLVSGAVRRSRRRVNRARGADRPDWAPGLWHCASCLSTNTPSASSCRSCRRPRRDLDHQPAEVLADVIPELIAVAPGSMVALHHDARAHMDPGDPHWRVTVGGLTVGSAATRGGVSALLRALDGADIVLLDIRGDGTAPYRLADVIARFEAARFPLDVACPEAVSGSTAR